MDRPNVSSKISSDTQSGSILQSNNKSNVSSPSVFFLVNTQPVNSNETGYKMGIMKPLKASFVIVEYAM